MTGRRPYAVVRSLGAVALLLACSDAPRERSVGFHRGMALGLFSRDDPAAIAADLDELQDLGVGSVSLVVPKVIEDVRSTQLRDGRWVTPSDGALRLAIRGAHRRGMRVMLFPTLFVENLAEGEWRGTLAPADWDRWFHAYGSTILHYARMAQAEGVELLSVGSELVSSESHEAGWRNLIRSVREVYDGDLLYSANWDHFQDIPFLDELDYLGINAYYQLTEASRPELDELRRGWEPILRELRSWSRRNGRPLLFTEVGYPSREGAGVDPWDHTADRPADPELQRRCYRAFIDVWRNVPELGGVFFYLWWGEGGPEDPGYTPRNKPAQDEIASWFQDGDREEREP